MKRENHVSCFMFHASFSAYFNLLLKWNKTYNLTAITKPDEIWEKHFLDSLAVVKFLPEKGSLLDVGSGAGFPGIPIKIAKPELSVTLLEATKKKCNFCEAVIRELGLEDIRVVHGRTISCHSRASGNPLNSVDSHFRGNDIPASFDIIISRATFSLKEFAEFCLPYLKDKNSSLIAMKGPNIDDELNILRASNLPIGKLRVEKYELPKSKAKRTLVLISSAGL